MLLLLSLLQPQGFGTFVKEGEAAPVPGRMTYNSQIPTVFNAADHAALEEALGATVPYTELIWAVTVCDPEWNDPAVWHLGTMDRVKLCGGDGAGTCAKAHGDHTAEYDWCYSTSDSSTSAPWCWCLGLDDPQQLENVRRKVDLHGTDRKFCGYTAWHCSSGPYETTPDPNPQYPACIETCQDIRQLINDSPRGGLSP